MDRAEGPVPAPPLTVLFYDFPKWIGPKQLWDSPLMTKGFSPDKEDSWDGESCNNSGHKEERIGNPVTIKCLFLCSNFIHKTTKQQIPGK